MCGRLDVWKIGCVDDWICYQEMLMGCGVDVWVIGSVIKRCTVVTVIFTLNQIYIQ